MELIDQPTTPRQGEQLDAAKLEAYLLAHLPASTGPLVIEQFPSGHSNLTYLIRLGTRELVLRRPPFGSKVKSAHDMGREFRILTHLHPIYPQAPKPLLYCEDDTVIGAPFYIMERIRGLILRKDPPPGLHLSANQTRRMALALIDNLAALHNLDYRAAGLADLGRPEGYVERQVSGWTRRYFDAQTDDVPAVVQVAEWLKEKMPRESGAALIHNDYKFDNVILDPTDPTRIVGVLDWEMSTIGDPLMDLGTALGYWVEAGDADEMKMIRFGPTLLPGMPARAELAQRYAEVTGRNLAQLDFYYVFALFKTAVVVQQIYYRYAKGFTKDERFASFVFAVHILSNEARKAIEASRL